MKKHPNLCRAFLFFIGVFLAALPTQAKVYDFENESDNAYWHFINGAQTNKWVINTSAGSKDSGTKALYVSGGTSYSYSNTTSTVWAYCDDVLSGTVTVSFDWKGTGESSYDYMYAYLVPVSASQPTAGSTTAPTGAIQIGNGFNGQSSWTTFTDQERTLSGAYRLYLMWHNDGSVNGSPIAVDNVNVGNKPLSYPSFEVVREDISQSTANVTVKYTRDTTYQRLGYIFEQDTVWNEDATSDSIIFTTTNLLPDSAYQLSFIAEDSVRVDRTHYISQTNSEGWSGNVSVITHDAVGYMLFFEDSTWSSHSVELTAGVEYTLYFRTCWGGPSQGKVYLCKSATPSEDDILLVTWYYDDYTSHTITKKFTPAVSGTYYIAVYGSSINQGDESYDIDGLSVYCEPHNELGYYTETDEFTTRPIQATVTSASSTQSTISVSIHYDCGDVPTIDRCGLTYYKSGDNIVDTIFFTNTNPNTTLDTIITGLTLDTRYAITPFVDINGTRYFKDNPNYVSTKDIYVSMTYGTSTETTIPITFRYDFGDADALNTGVNGIEYCLGSQFTDNSDIQTIQINSMASALSLDTIVRDLMPNTQYTFRPYVNVESTGRKYGTVKTARTKSVSLDVTQTNITQTTLSLQFTYNFGDADALNMGVNGIEYCVGSQFTDDSDIQTIQINSMDSALSLDTIMRGLIPNTQYALRPYVEIASIGRAYGAVKTAWTESISLNVSRTDRTQTTLSLQFTYDFGDADIDYIDGNLGDVQSFRLYPASSTGTIDTTFTHLRPGTEYTISASAILTSGVSCGSTSGTYTTLPVSLGTPNVSGYGQTYVVVNSSYDYGDATLVRNVLEFKRSISDDAEIDTTLSVTDMQTKFTNMHQNTTYYFRQVLEFEGGLNKFYDFENAGDNTRWHFINGEESNKWVIGTSAGSNGTGGKALYVSSGTSYSYSNTTSTVWAYCDDVLSGTVTISFDWKGTGESGYDYMYAYLVPVSANQPTAGSTTAPTGAIQIGSRFNGQSSWTTFTDQERTLTGQYRLYFMWHNDDDTNRSPIAIDNIGTDGTRWSAGNIILTTDWQEFTTKPITLTTQEADGISNTSALLHGTVDCDQESYTEIGFEWKWSDAPATYRPQRLLVTDRVDENLLFRLEGLDSKTWYDFRTFCSYQGETYYGEWTAFRTTNDAVLVAPTVQTVGATANEQGAEMEGFIVTGTEPILQKGFEVWIKGGTDVKTTVAEGSIIRALIPEPWSYTTYRYKAYAKTASGTTYGETVEVTTGYIPRDVQDIVVTPSSNSAEVTWTEIEVADYYILTLFADEAMTDTLAVYQVGTDGSISRLRMPSAVKALVTCSIEDLTPATDYYFAVVAYNGADQKVAEESGTFATEPDPTGIRQTTDEPSPAVRKILYRGQVFILRNGKTYTLTGQEIR